METAAAIKEVLRKVVGTSLKGLEGLHFAAFLSPRPDGSPEEPAENRQAVNEEALWTMLKLHNLGHGVKDQVGLWNKLIPEVHRSFLAVQKGVSSRADGNPRSLKRLVLDVEVGGVMYAPIEDRGWVFAATLNQQTMNDGSAEQNLLEIVVKLSNILRPTPAAIRLDAEKNR
jgi:hypothetical protein